MTGRLTLGGAALAALLLAQGQAGACAVHGAVITGLTASDPASIPVALATRTAIASGLVADLPREPIPRQGALAMLFYAASALSRDATRSKPDAPPFAVLLIESGHWLRFGGAEVASAHAGPPPGTTVLVLSDAAFAGLLAGLHTPASLARIGALAARGVGAEEAKARFASLIVDFAGSGLGSRMADSVRRAIARDGEQL